MPRKPSPKLETAAELAVRQHVTQRTVREWVQEGCPRRKDGRFNPAKVDEWLAQRPVAKRQRAQRAAPAPAREATELEALKAEEMRLRVERARLEMDEARGRLVPVEEVERALVARIHQVRRGMSALLQRYGARWSLPEEQEADLARELDWLCEQYANGVPGVAAEAVALEPEA